MEIEGGNLCQYFCRINAPRDDAIATRGNLRLDRTNKRFEGAMRDLLLNKTFIQHDAGEKTPEKVVNMEQMKVTPSVIVMSYGLIPFSRILKNILREGRLP